MSTFGRNVLSQGSGGLISITADGKPEWKHGGITLDWTTVAAIANAPETFNGRIMPVGEKYLPYGTVIDKITATGLYGPLDTTASDGREAAKRGETYLLNETVVQSDPNSDHPAVLEGGLVYLSRLKVGGSGQITEANLLLALPRLRLVRETA